jgi:hypothetical protein
METAVSEMRGPDSERRSDARKGSPEEHGLVSARVRPGRDAAVIDVSAGGALIETLHRLLPGTTIDLHLTAVDRRITVRGRVMRSAVTSLHATGVRYRSALMFERSLASFLDVDGYSIPVPLAPVSHHGREDATPPTL